MDVYRILKAPYHTDPLATIGSELYPGRWNGTGQGLLYTASHPALALVETMVHFETVPLANLPQTQMTLFVLAVDDALIKRLNRAALPLGWNGPQGASLTQGLLTDWIDDPVNGFPACLGVEVPSAVLPISTNYLFAPKHPAFGSIRPVSNYLLPLDPRLWRI